MWKAVPDQSAQAKGAGVLSSVANAFRVLEHVVDQKHVGVSEVSRDLGLSVATAHRLLGTLVTAGFVVQDADTRRYRPGPKVSELARRAHQSGDFSQLAHEVIARLMARTGETVNLGVLRDGEVVYVDRAVTDQPLAVTVRVGSRVPAYCTSLGKAILAHRPATDLAAYLARLAELAAGRDQRPPSATRLKRELVRTRERGYAEDRGEFAPEISCVAAPVLDADGLATGAVSISGPTPRIERRHDEFAEAVLAAGRELSDLLVSTGEALRA